MSSGSPTTTVDSLLRAVARTPRLEVAPRLPHLEPQAVLAGTFEIVGELGRGGMGVVYRAHDRRLDREVAIKVMRADRWAHVPHAQITEILEREARATARLNHPSIVTLHQTGEHEGSLYLVLELLRGESLAARLRRPLPAAVAVAMMAKIADAVAHAHGQGVLHRDLKPHNVFVGDDGHVWVLDFGLASLHEVGTAEERVAAMSRAGTPSYMAPEQRVGAAQDVRTDVWALGLLLYQMVTAYEPPPLIDAAALEGGAWAADLARLPPPVAALIRSAVRWDPAARLPTAAGFASALAAIDRDALDPVAPPRRRPWRRLAAGVAVIALGAAIAVGLRARGSGGDAPIAPIEFSVAVAASEPLATFQTQPVAVSPDGRTIVFIGHPPPGGVGAAQLYLRRIDRDEAVPLPDTEDAEGPFFSPDGAWLGFAKGGELYKLPLAGGPAIALGAVQAGTRGGTWLPDDRLVIAPSWFSPLAIVSADGGPMTPLTTLGPDEKSHRFPHALPDGRAVLFVVSSATSDSFDDTTVEAVELATGARRVITTGGAPRFVPPSTLLVPRAGQLVALPFDPRRLAVTGPPRIVIDDAVTAPANGAAMFDVRGGTLAYFVGSPALFATQVARIDRAGAATLVALPEALATSVRAGADDKLMVRADAANATLWLHDLARQTDTRISWRWDVDHAVLAPGHQQVYAVVSRGARAEIQRLRADGTGDAETLHTGLNPANLELSRDGRTLVFDDRDPRLGTADLYWLDPIAPGPPRAYLASAEHETQPALSPDGRWLAYTSSVSGKDEIYVQAFPTPGLRVQISVRGGNWARWNPDGTELLYRNGAAVMTVAVRTDAAGVLVPAPPQERYVLDDVADHARRTFDVTPSGELVTVVRPPTWRPADRLRVILHWQPTALAK